MNPVELVVHLGAHKTGSTAIQADLELRREELTDLGFYVAGWPGGALNHSFVATWVFEGDYKSVELWLAKETEGARARSCHTIIMNGEDLSAFTADEVDSFAKLVRRFVPEIRPVMYVRNKASYYYSQYVHWLAHNAAVNLPEFVREMEFSPRTSVLAWGKARGTAIELFRVEEIGDSSTNFFEAVLGIRADGQRRENVSLDPLSALLVNHVAKQFPMLNLDAFTYRLAHRNSVATVGTMRETVALDVSGFFESEDWILDVGSGREVALIDDRGLSSAPLSEEDLESLRALVIKFFDCLSLFANAAWQDPEPQMNQVDWEAHHFQNRREPAQSPAPRTLPGDYT